MKFVDVFGHSHELRHRPKGFAAEVHIQASDDHPNSAGCQFLSNYRNLGVKELSFINSNHCCVRIKLFANLRRAGNWSSFVICPGM